MNLTHGLHLAYCTNIHRGGNWADTFASLEKHTMAVRRQVAPDRPYAIGLRLGDVASRELSDPATLRRFHAWLKAHDAHVFTINGFPFGNFHGGRVKEQVYAPDWTSPERLAYTKRLFELLAGLLPDDPSVEGSVSTVPVSFKGFRIDDRQARLARRHLWECIDFLEQLTRRTGRKFHLGLEPEPLCYLETSGETVGFFEQMRADRPGDLRIDEHLGVNYDCCHLAIEYETPADALGRLRRAGIKVSKIHLSNALRLKPTPEAREALRPFVDAVYFHQVIERLPEGDLIRYADLDEALATRVEGPQLDREWRVHFHIPLHAAPFGGFGTTADHVLGVLDEVRAHPRLCQHFEMETYTWEVLPPEMKQHSVVDQLVAEYRWTLAEFAKRGIVERKPNA
jgi:sugar phosphate isomerase/epimerase